LSLFSWLVYGHGGAVASTEEEIMGRRPVVRGLTLATVLLLAIAALATVPPTAASATVENCPGGGSMVVNVYATYSNSADYGADGHIWALDAARESIQIWQVGANTYCLKRQDIGTFTSFAGVSPEGTGTVRAGVTGRWTGEIVALIHGTFAPTLATSGFLGDFDGQLTARPYFSSIASVDFLAFSATFEAGTCGVWRQSLRGDTGDIVC
jgi:hypothetical protein